MTVNWNQVAGGSPEWRQHLDRLSATDGNPHDLSVQDLTRATESDLKAVITGLKAGGYNRDEQTVVEMLIDLSRQADAFPRTHDTAYDLETGTPHQVAFPDLDPARPGRTGDAVRRALYRSGTVHRDERHAESTYRFSQVVANALGVGDARMKLHAEYGFAPTNPYDLGAVRTLAGNLRPRQLPDFIATYLQAYFAHPGGGTDWQGAVERQGRTAAVLFGDPPALDQLPDGRYVIDCQGFAAAAGLLYDALRQGPADGEHFCLPIEMYGHAAAIMRDGSDVYIVDNDLVTRLEVDPAELARLRQRFDRSREDGLDDTRIRHREFPSLFRYLDQTHPGVSAHPVEWDEGHALRDG